VAELHAVAAEHERLWAHEQERQRRSAKLEALLPKLAEALDVRRVFLGMAGLIREIVPHDVVGFALLSPDRGGVKVQAASLAGMHDMPEYRFSHEEEALDANWKYLLSYDLVPEDDGWLRAVISPRDAIERVEVRIRPGEAWTSFIRKAGIRSSMRVPIRLKDRPIGGVAFLSRHPFLYDEEDGAFAHRIADHIALALAHQELADEEKRIAQAEERAVLLEEKVETLSRELQRFSAHRALGRTPVWKKVLAEATQVAATDTTVLFTGESGTGKEVVARYVHRGSPRAKGPFVALNCAALPEQLLESELFGHERGAFTGALISRAGKIEQAEGGVLFLDEVGEMTPPVQAKLLRVLQEREYQRVGGSKTLRADVRIVAATNRDPRRAMETGALREDLYYRLSVFEIRLPPLRERADDILVLVEAFLAELAGNVGRPAAGISEDARETLLSHSWPGNVRELRNAIERAVILCGGGLITREHLPIALAERRALGAAASPAAVTAGGPANATADSGGIEFPEEGVRLESVERDLLLKSLSRARGNKSEAARLLGLTRGQLYSLLRRHGLTQAKR
jgi:transcriptional regulator with GAF, ATPase, and Fis domain